MYWVEEPDFLIFSFDRLLLQELDLLNDSANVYKLIGPVLVKQDLAEARANVRKRIEYISAELWVFADFVKDCIFICLLIDENWFCFGVQEAAGWDSSGSRRPAE